MAGVWMSSELVPMSSLMFCSYERQHPLLLGLLILRWAQCLTTPHGGGAVSSSFLVERWELGLEVKELFCVHQCVFHLETHRLRSPHTIGTTTTNGDELFRR